MRTTSPKKDAVVNRHPPGGSADSLRSQIENPWLLAPVADLALAVTGRMRKIFVTLWLGLMVSCSSVPNGRVTSRTYIREVVLSWQHPEDDFLKARLVAVAQDGTTTIEVISTGDTLRAAPGGYFASTAYGTQGLKLISASAEKHEARFLRTWCVTK